MSSNNIGKRIKVLREENNLTPDKLAILLGMTSPKTIIKIENNEIDPTRKQLEHLAFIFNVTIDELTSIQEEDLSDYIGDTKSVIVRKKFSIIKKLDIIIFGILNLVFFLIPLFKKDETKQYLYATFVVVSILLLIYYVIIGIFRARSLDKTITIPVDRSVRYYSTMPEQLIKKYNKDRIILTVLLFVLNVFYYGIIYSTINKLNGNSGLLVLIGLISFLILKLVVIVINYKDGYKGNLYYLVLLFVVETILNIFLLMTLLSNNVLTTEIALFGGFNLLVSYFMIIISNFFISKFKYRLN